MQLWGPPGRTSENLPHTLGMDARRALDRWISVGVSVFEPTPAAGDNPGVLPVSSPLRPTCSNRLLNSASGPRAGLPGTFFWWAPLASPPKKDPDDPYKFTGRQSTAGTRTGSKP